VNKLRVYRSEKHNSLRYMRDEVSVTVFSSWFDDDAVQRMLDSNVVFDLISPDSESLLRAEPLGDFVEVTDNFTQGG